MTGVRGMDPLMNRGRGVSLEKIALMQTVMELKMTEVMGTVRELKMMEAMGTVRELQMMEAK